MKKAIILFVSMSIMIVILFSTIGMSCKDDKLPADNEYERTKQQLKAHYQKFHPEKMGEFLSNLKEGQLKGIQAVVFDTRIRNFMSEDALKKISKELIRADAVALLSHMLFMSKVQRSII